jgi:hypothetical protein
MFVLHISYDTTSNQSAIFVGVVAGFLNVYNLMVCGFKLISCLFCIVITRLDLVIQFFLILLLDSRVALRLHENDKRMVIHVSLMPFYSKDNAAARVRRRGVLVIR